MDGAQILTRLGKEVAKVYRKKYNELVKYRKQNPPPAEEYVEKHHVIPRSIRPDLIKDPENIVALTAAEHFRAHYFLANAYREEGDKTNYRKMLFALQRMKQHTLKNVILEEAKLNAFSEIYETVRKELHEVGHSAEAKRKMSIARKNRRPISEETRRRMSETHKGEKNYMYGKHLSEETRRKIGESSKGRHFKLSDEQKKKISITHKGEIHPMYGKHFSKEACQNMSEAHKGQLWWNDGTVQKRCHECPGPDFVRGRLQKGN